MTVKISVVISTYNRAASLERCLNAFRQVIHNSEWELIVVDNASTDTTQRVVNEFARDRSIPLQYVFQPVRGLGNARNAGISVASGDIIAFTDDDCYVTKSYLQETAAAFADETIGFTTGRIMLYDSDDHPVTINESMTSKAFLPGRYLPPGEVKGANMAFRRALLERISGFDPDFGSGAKFPAEDCDAAARASLAGWSGRYVPEICVYHHHGRKVDQVTKLLRAYDLGRGAYHAKLLLSCKQPALFLKGLRGLPRRVWERPQAIIWELYGSVHYAFLFARRRLKSQ